MADSPLIKIEKGSKQYENEEVITKVLFDIDLTIEAGEFIAIMGPSGSGKSTLMHIIGFLDRLSSGKYFYKGTDVTEFEDEELSRLRNEEVGFIFQAFNLLPRTSVLENVILPLTYASGEANEQKARKVIDAVGLGHRVNNLSNQLSGGEKQRTAIARALVNNPSIVFADEPTGNLDSKTGAQIMQLIQNLNDQGKTVILVTHEQDVAEHAKRIVFLRDGRVESDTEVSNRTIAADGHILKK